MRRYSVLWLGNLEELSKVSKNTDIVSKRGGRRRRQEYKRITKKKNSFNRRTKDDMSTETFMIGQSTKISSGYKPIYGLEGEGGSQRKRERERKIEGETGREGRGRESRLPNEFRVEKKYWQKSSQVDGSRYDKNPKSPGRR